MANVIVIIILILVIGLALFTMWKNRKKGMKCVGCLYASTCGGGCSHQKNSDLGDNHEESNFRKH